MPPAGSGSFWLGCQPHRNALMRTAFSQAAREGQQVRLRTIHDLDAAARTLSTVCQCIEGRPNASLHAAPRAVIPRSWQRYVLPRMGWYRSCTPDNLSMAFLLAWR